MNLLSVFKSFIITSLSKDMGRLSLLLPVFLGCGIYTQYSGDFSIKYIGITIMCLCVVALMWSRMKDMIKITLIIAITICVGMMSYAFRTQLSGHNLIKYRTTATVSGMVVDSQYSPKKTRIILQDVTIDDKNYNGLIRLNIKEQVTVGSIIKIRAMLFPPAKPIINNAFDFRRYAYFKKIGAFGKAIGKVEIIKPTRVSYGATITKNIYNHLPERTASLATALITGNRLGITKQDTNALRGSGLAHLLAISGLHIGFVMGVIYFCIRFIGVLLFDRYTTTFSLKKTASIASLSIGFLYGVLAGFPIPTIRAFLMASLVVLGVLTYRRVFTMRSVALVASLILLLQPESLFTPSFQLSFGAVAGLVGVYEMGTFKRRGVYAFLHGVLLSSLVAMLATTPFAIYHFGTVGTYSVLANMFAIPLMGFVVVPSLMIGVFESLLFGTGVFLNIGGFSIDIMMAWAKFIYDLPHSVLTYAGGNSLALVIFSIGFYAFFVLQQSWRYILLFCGLVGVIMMLQSPPLPLGYVMKNGTVVLLQDNKYVLSGRKNSYFMRAIKHQTNIDVVMGDICKTDTCIKNNIAVVMTDKMPRGLCKGRLPKRYKDNSAVKFIIAPKVFIKRCDIPSIDKMDLYLNASYTLHPNYSISIVEPFGKPWE